MVKKTTKERLNGGQGNSDTVVMDLAVFSEDSKRLNWSFWTLLVKNHPNQPKSAIIEVEETSTPQKQLQTFY